MQLSAAYEAFQPFQAPADSLEVRLMRRNRELESRIVFLERINAQLDMILVIVGLFIVLMLVIGVEPII